VGICSRVQGRARETVAMLRVLSKPRASYQLAARHKCRGIVVLKARFGQENGRAASVRSSLSCSRALRISSCITGTAQSSVFGRFFSKPATEAPSCRAVRTTLVQAFGIYETKRSGTLRSSCGENCIPNWERRFVSNTKLSEIELTFLHPMRELNAGDGDRGAP